MARNRIARVGTAMVLALGVLYAGVALAAETVVARGAVHDGFGRIVFDWPVPTTYDAVIEGRVLTITFSRSLEASLGAVQRSLAAYIGSAWVTADGRGVAFALTGDFELRSFTYEKSIVVDVVGATRAAAPPPAGGESRQARTSQAQARQAQARQAQARQAQARQARARQVSPGVSIRVSDHGGYSRIVFDWRRTVDYKVVRKGDRVIVRFNRPAEIDLSPLEATPLRNVLTGRAEVEGKRTVVSLTIPPLARLRHFRSGTKVVLDVLGDREPIVIGNAGPAPPPAPRAEGASVVAGAPPVAEPPAPEIAEPVPEAEPETEAAPVKLAGAEAPDMETVAMESEAMETEAMETETSGPAATEGLTRMDVDVEVSPDATRLSFNPGQRLASAAFIHNGSLWVVFPGQFAIDLIRAQVASTDAYESIVQVPHAEATILRVRLRPGYGVTFRRRSTMWMAVFSTHPESPASIGIQPFDDELRGVGVHFQIADVAEYIRLNDPDSGDAFLVVPVGASSAGVVPGQSFPGFDLLATAQGIVARPTARGLEIHTSLAGVEIGNPAGQTDRQAEKATRISRRTRPAINFFDLAIWRRGGESQFPDNRRAMLTAIAEAPPGWRTRAQIEHLQFLFAHGYFAEVLGSLRLVFDDDPGTRDDLQLRAIRGVSRLMLDRFAGAKEDLGEPGLDPYDDIALWRGVLASREGDMQAATAQFVRAGDLWLDIVPALRNHIGLIAAEAAIESLNLSAANAYLDAILASRPKRDIRDRAKHLRGRALLASGKEGDDELALALWDEVTDSRDRYTRARVQFDRTMYKLGRAEIDTVGAIKELESLRFVWRGDAFELQLLQQLADLYFAKQEYSRGLEAMKQAVTFFAGHPASAVLAGRMNELFSEIFLQNLVEDLPTRKVLTLYYGFRELSPVGNTGDKVTQALADRLVAVDLLGQAAELLEHQIAYRLEGVEKARVGSRLAVIRLMDRKPDLAIEALNSSKATKASDKLKAQRRHLQARALIDLKRGDEALKLLKGDNSRDAALVRADLFWRDNKWERMVSATLRVLEDTPVETPLSPFASNHILRLALALALARDEKGLRKVRKRYGDKMAGDPNEGAFDLIASEIDRKGLSLRDLPAAVAQVADFEAFMQSYRDRAKRGALSSIN